MAWRHCQIRREANRFLVYDLRSSGGTYVNGMRSAERWLQDRDQIGVGKTILMFRSGESMATEELAQRQPDAKPVLLASCSLVFLFRALAASVGEAQNGLLQNQILRLIQDLIPTREGLLLVGTGCDELRARFREQYTNSEPGFEKGLVRICEEGAFEDAETGTVGVPLYVGGTLNGAIILGVEPNEKLRLASHLDVLTAVASLASVAFEANREVETLRVEKALLEEQIGSPTGIV
ncbi:MAG: FHA domain-containing protein, partial [Bryobacteraceae bacterium]